MFRKIAIGALTLVVIAAAAATMSPAQPVASPAPVAVSSQAAAATVRQFLAPSLLEPASAVFGTVLTGSFGGHIAFCGEVSARNSFGGMTPMQAFVVVPAENLVLIQGRDSADAIVSTWEAACPH